MALKTIRLRREIDLKKGELEAKRAKDAEYEKREAELNTAIEEAESNEDLDSIDGEIEKFETEKGEHESAKNDLEAEIGRLEDELRSIEEASEKRASNEETSEKRAKETRVEIMRERFFDLSMQERDAFFSRADVKDFLSNVRTSIKEKRAIENVGLTIPEVMLPIIKQIAYGRSRLLSKVTVRRVSGTGREIIMGAYPEAVWTEMCATLNELTLGFNDIEIDGYKVGGYFDVCNAILEDNDVNLASEIIQALGESIAKAIDKAIVYGKGTKMPLGIVTRLAQTAKPADYPVTAREWKDLHESNILKGTKATEIPLFIEIMRKKKAIKNDYYNGGIIWLMNETTHTELLINSVGKNSNAAIVAGMNNTMPVLGGEIIELPFIPDNNIVAGYLPAYLWGERRGIQLSSSEHFKFIQDRTIFKGTMRADGKPVIPEAFVAFTISDEDPATSVAFPSDTANAGA